MSIHSHQVHCIHVHGWYTRNWCYRCRRHWAETCGVDGCSNYEQTATDDLVRAVVREMCDGDVPIPVELLALDLSDLAIDNPTPSEPSAN
jgi:hypothetical protein